MGRKDAAGIHGSSVDQYRKQIGKQDYKKVKKSLKATKAAHDLKKSSTPVKCLWESLKCYIDEERFHFLKQVRGQRFQLGRKQRRVIDKAAEMSRSKLPGNTVDPLYFFNCVTLDADSVTSSPLSQFSSPIRYDSAMSRPMTSYSVSITEEQMSKAMEIAVLCSEYGVSMMLPQHLPKPSQLVDILHSDYGSLHVTRVPTVRHEWLRSLREKPKINIESLKVSRGVLLNKFDPTSLIKDTDMDDSTTPRDTVGMFRRFGMNSDLPTKPKSLMEVLSNTVQFDFFKRFMVMHNMSLPVVFWRAVEDLYEIQNKTAREIKVEQIRRKFFGRCSKYGAALDCDEEIIRQIPNMEKVDPDILIWAQAAVFRSLERKWFQRYIATFPTDPDPSDRSPDGFTPTKMMKNFEEAAEFASKTKTLKKRMLTMKKTLMTWKRLSRALADFVKAVSSKLESQVFEMFLKFELKREKQLGQLSQGPPKQRNVMKLGLRDNVQTRVLVRNRLIIMNRLPSDLRFWVEVRKYQNLVDSALQKSSISDQDTEFLADKARSIISCFLASEIMPKVQVNIPNDMALNIIDSLISSGPKRGLFHDAIVLIFPILYHFYHRFSEEWMKGDIPDEYFDYIEQKFRGHVSTLPHHNLDIPDFTALDMSQIKTMSSQDEQTVKIHFSISEGASITYPQDKYNKLITKQVKRKSKYKQQEPNEETSPQKESRGGQGDKKSNKQCPKGGVKGHHEHDFGRKHSTNNVKKKKSGKIVVKISEQVSPDDSTEKNGSIDKAGRLSFLIASFNKEKEEKKKEQKKMLSNLIPLNEVVVVAMDQSSVTN